MPAADLDSAKQNNSLRDFQGVNTQAARQVIGDNQFAWLENVQPVGFGVSGRRMEGVGAPHARATRRVRCPWSTPAHGPDTDG